ncbi:hypothetical protein [Rhizobium sp. 18065]|uniref:hypothetical protein n=1 Tax=Rhizobium sp. 18065 TaxID=2681411 RepID=UPI001356F8D4|nr:hypothetical protein [Rhizobium sp. 18065]
MTALEDTGAILARLLRQALRTRLERRDEARLSPLHGRKQDRLANVTEIEDERTGQ